MKPRMRERPTHAWGALRAISGEAVVDSGVDDVDEAGESIIWTSSPEVTVLRGSESFSSFMSSGMTGPGDSENAEVSASPPSSSALLRIIGIESPSLLRSAMICGSGFTASTNPRPCTCCA